MSQYYTEFCAGLRKSGEDIVAEMTPEKANILHMAVGVSGEAGELLDAIKKHTMYNKELDYANVIEEMGDTEFYLEGLRTILNISREEVIRGNVEKLSKRYSFGKFSNQQAQDRADKREEDNTEMQIMATVFVADVVLDSSSSDSSCNSGE